MRTTPLRDHASHVRPEPSGNRPQTKCRPVSDTDLSTIVGLLEDEHARRILTATSVEPMSKTELADNCDVSLPTISRRIERLDAADLVDEQTRARPDGHHDTVYVARLDRFEVRLRDGELEYDLQRMDRDMTSELQRLWSKF
jgi:DNA-binding transcriptional ArsR family regulator